MKWLLTALALVILSAGSASALSPAPEYRAVLIGNSDYAYLTDLNGPVYDVHRIEQVLQASRYGQSNSAFSEINILKNATKTSVLNAIYDTFEGADEDDVSYFYFSGHGAYDTTAGQAYICPTDAAQLQDNISIDELKAALDSIDGTKVVILDSCFSGGAINKSAEPDADATSEQFNQTIISAFTAYPESSASSKGYLTTDQYKVLTASNKTENSFDVYEQDWGWGGEFTNSLVRGCGYSSLPYPADSSGDGDVSLSEIYSYSKTAVKGSSVQVYPEGDTAFEFAGGFDSSSYALFETEPGISSNVALDKEWTLVFSRELEAGKLTAQNIYILGSDNLALPCQITLLPGNKKVSIKPDSGFEPGSEYRLFIEKSITDKSSTELEQSAMMIFNTQQAQ